MLLIVGRMGADVAKTAVLFQTHFFDRWAAAAFRRLSSGAASDHEFVVVLHLPPSSPVPRRLQGVCHHVVRTPELRALPYPAKVGGGANWHLWGGGHTDLIALHFCLAHPEYERYWSVEYDVAFSGPWRRFFSAFENDASDLLAPVVTRHRDIPEWDFWKTLTMNGKPPDDVQMLRSFMPIFRASRRLVQAVDTAYRTGWGGHLECTWATIAMEHGLGVADIGGDGEFTALHNRNRFYSSSPFNKNLFPGTMRFYPPLYRRGSVQEMLWHPVKPFWFRIELRRALLIGRSRLAGLIRTKAPWLLPPRWREFGSFSNPRGSWRWR